MPFLPPQSFQRGFSLLEMLVAIALLALLLGTLYQVATGATRNVRVAERYSYATVLAESLLAEHGGHAPAGYRDAGSSGDFTWSLRTRPLEPRDPGEPERLQWVEVAVRWGTLRPREVVLTTLAPVLQEQRL